MQTLLLRTLLVISSLSAASVSFGQSQIIQSQTKPPLLLELYTSQGCSSCPPAERWFSELKDSADLWQNFIPINFHVDYWDYLGWKDPFAQAKFSQRQRHYKQLGYSKNVATPGFMANGQQWNGWFYRRAIPGSQLASPGQLEATIDEKKATVRFAAKDKAKHNNLRLHTVTLGFDLKHKIKAGENRRKTLQHDFVVLSHQSESFDPTKGTTLKIPSDKRFKANKRAIVFWLSQGRDPRPILAMGDWL